MKKTNTILVLIVQVIAIIIFSNIYALFKPMEIFEMDSLVERTNSTAELFLLKYQTNLTEMQREGYFDEISMETGNHTENYTYYIDNEDAEMYLVKRPVPGVPGRTIVFRKKLDSLTLSMLKKLKKTFSTLSIMLGIFLVITGFYLIFVFKKEKGTKITHIPPLQDYLLQLKGSELQLKNLVQEQQVNVNRHDELSKSIINNINAAIILVNHHQRVDIFNQTAEQIFSRSFSFAKNNEIKNVMQHFPGILQFFNEHKDNPKNVSGEIDLDEGKVFKVDLVPVEKAGKLMIVRDISEEKNREKIDSRNKNFIMLGEMTAFLAHEIKNSLGVIYGYTRTMAPTEEKLAQKVNRVNREITFLTAMMENFLDFSKPIKIDKKEKIDMKNLLQTIAAEKEMSLHFEAEKGFIENDKTLFCSIFSNLMLNAKESGANHIEIKIDETSIKENINHLNITIKDNGSGISEKNREKIWYPFFTTKEKGTGMGLAIIRKIVSSLNGDIILLKSDNNGTVFKITFYS